VKTQFERGHRRDEDVDIDVRIVHETEFAILVNDGDTEDWIAKSLVKNFDWDPDYIGKDVTITIPERVAIKKGFV